VGEGVHAGGGGDASGQTQSEIRVGKNHLSEDFRAENDSL
jgi:hypothetical protein